MNEREAIEYLKERCDEIPALITLRYNNAEAPLWIQTIRGVIAKVFGEDSYEYKKLAEPYTTSGSSSVLRQNSYVRNMRRRAVAILSIIKTWETFGFETETKETSESQKVLDMNQTWKDIKKVYDESKRGFAMKIKFVTDSFKRGIIIRDTEQAFVLAQLGYSKPALILAGGVIEELLRLFVEHKGFTPKSREFWAYVEVCKEQGLLKSAVTPLSDSLRHFRNLVHLREEKTSNHTISQATAVGAVASIFTIANDFKQIPAK